MIKRTVSPTTEPVTLPEAKGHLNITVADDDTLISGLISAAREVCETFTRRALVSQTWRMDLDGFPMDEIQLAPLELQSVTSVAYIDADGVAQTVDPGKYAVDTSGGVIYPAYGEQWPSTRAQRNAVTITYVAGYGAASAVPQVIKQAMLLLISELYENREESGPSNVAQLPMTAERLLWPYRDLRF